RQLAHVATRVTQVSARPALSRDAEQLLRVIEAVDVKPVFREQVSVTSLPARHVEDARARRETQQLDEPGCFLTIALGRKQQPVFQKIVGVECRLPPLGFLFQKNTGSR